MTLEALVGVRIGALDLQATVSAQPGELVAIVGPNGAGKTTLLRALAGLVRLHSGRVAVDGQVIEDVEGRISTSPERRPIALMFQDGLLFPYLTATQNVAFGLRARGVPKRSATERADAWLARVGLADRGSSRPAQLSGGERQRVALARALITEPRLLLLDEPFASVDASARVDLRHLLRDQLSLYSGMRLLVTHDPLEAMALADRVIVLEQGRVAQSGLITEVTARPRSPWVATMLGLNLFRGVATATGLDMAGTTIAALSDVRGQAFAVVHPRAIALHRSRPEGSPRNVWRGEAESLDRDRDRVRVSIAGPIPVVAEVTPAAVAELGLGVGGAVWVSVKATEVQVYAE
ncbi:MAG: ABC transporter ATP-binding protein [Candidatus Dormibacteraeota bacterium]|uniref:ABC transporter ATP-binding protein n=1 Tax=Candidatus Amunia macphersoniae TaxID=3127014 RepID=A0A934KE55_9BACT|nr:ABC transporter ATP-binding protein [Candidatus Dormibacteraeota bacterium]